MPQEMSPGKPTTRRYREAEKEQAVRLVRQLREELGTDHGTIQRVAMQLGYRRESVRSWVTQAEIDDGVKPGHDLGGGGSDHASSSRRTGAAAGERDPAVGVGFLRGGARPPTEVMVGFIDAAS